MNSRRDTPGRSRGDPTAVTAVVFETDEDGRVRTLGECADVVFRHRDEPLVGKSIEALETEGVFAAGTTTRYRQARKHLASTDESPGVTFDTAIGRGTEFDPVTYLVRLEDFPEGAYRWSVAEVGLPRERNALLDTLGRATAALSSQGTVRNVYGSLERWVNTLLGPTGVDVRRADSETGNLFRVTRTGATTPVDERTVVDVTEPPYDSVWPAGETLLFTDGELGDGFGSVAVVPLGTVGTLTIGRVGADVTPEDVNALELLAESAATAVKAVDCRSLVDDQRAELDRYETLVESIPDPVYSTDSNGRITYVNRAFEDEFGYRFEECRGTRITEYTTGEANEKIRDVVDQLRDPERERYTRVSLTGVKRDGREREIDASVGVVYHDHEFDGVVGVLRDVTERRRREQISAVMDRALRHNLRTSINNIIGYAELTQQGNDDTGEYLRIIRDEGEWLLKLGETIRAVRRVLEGDTHNGVELSVRELVDPLLAEYRKQFPDAVIVTEYQADAEVRGGASLQVALDNVIENALVHNDGDEPGVEIRTRVAANGWIEIQVADDGPGIPDRERTFVTEEQEITKLQHGTGVGLWITRWIVEIFDGELVIHSDGDGTVVTIRLRQTGG